MYIRYEYYISLPGTVFAAGFTLDSLAAGTCDEAWNPRFVTRDPKLVQLDAFKLVQLSGMATYLDTRSSGFADTLP